MTGFDLACRTQSEVIDQLLLWVSTLTELVTHFRFRSLALSLGVHEYSPNRSRTHRRRGEGQPSLNGAEGEVGG